MRLAYLHGFASGPQSRKGRHLRTHFASCGHELLLPELNRPSFEQLSLRAMLAHLDRLDDAEGDAEGWGFVGSSLGGWLAARWAEQRPKRVARLLLLCPAFDLAQRWPALLPDGAMEMWRRGSLLLPDGTGTPRPVHYGFYEEALAQPAYPVVTCPTRIVHGRLDDRVPLASSAEYARRHANVSLLEVEDGHDLAASLPLIEVESRWLLGASE